MRIPILPQALATRLTVVVARTRRTARLAALWGLLLLAVTSPLAQAADHVTLYVTDIQGTVVAELTPQATGSAQVTYEAAYRPYGQQALGVPQAGPGYTGHVNDPHSGLVYMQARYYDPMTERFPSVDPVGPTPGNIFNFNRYAYANNNPIVNTDPTGMCGDVSAKVQRMRNTSDVSNGGVARCFVAGEYQTDFGTTIGSVPGYTETGGNSWRASNDWAFISAADSYNREHNLHEGDNGFMSYTTLKSWAMVESGGSKKAFLTDPLQVNNLGDAAPDKLALLGLAANQEMSPYSSAYSAENWWRHKGYLHDATGAEVSWRGDAVAFQRYNGNTAMDRTLNGRTVPHYLWYAAKILELSAQMQK